MLALYSRYKELVDKNERTKANIRKRDEAAKAKQDKLLEESAVATSMYMAQRKQ